MIDLDDWHISLSGFIYHIDCPVTDKTPVDTTYDPTIKKYRCRACGKMPGDDIDSISWLLFYAKLKKKPPWT